MSLDYDRITETGGTPITEEAASMVYTRYLLAAQLAAGRRTLEIGCASGVGLGLMLKCAKTVIGGDLHLAMLQTAKDHYGNRVPLARFSATDLPFAEGAFDFVLFLEATYYVRDFTRALDEIERVLSPGGVVLFVNANPERPDFIRSPYSEHYHSAEEFRRLLEARGFAVETSAGYPLERKGGSGILSRAMAQMLPGARRVAEALKLVPKTLKGRARIKRLIFGKLSTLPRELPANFARVENRVEVNGSPVRDFKVIYVIGRRSDDNERLSPARMSLAANNA